MSSDQGNRERCSRSVIVISVGLALLMGLGKVIYTVGAYDASAKATVQALQDVKAELADIRGDLSGMRGEISLYTQRNDARVGQVERRLAALTGVP